MINAHGTIKHVKNNDSKSVSTLTHGRTSSYALTYKIAWSVEPAVTACEQEIIKTIICKVATDNNINIISLTFEENNVVVTVGAPPSISVLVIVKKLKGITARKIMSHDLIKMAQTESIFGKRYVAESVMLSDHTEQVGNLNYE